MRQLFVVLSLIILVIGLNPSWNAAHAETFPEFILLPDGFRPEGVVVGGGHHIYAGSLANGAIYRSDLRTGQGEIIVPGQEGRMAVGLSFDKRSNFLFVAGGPTGAAYVYDVQTGADVAVYQLAGPSSFINDVVVTRSAAYFTDSFSPVLYRIALDPRGRLPDSGTVEEIPLSGDYVFSPFGFNTNGIDATPDGDLLLIVNSTTGKLYNVDPQSGDALLIDLGGESVPMGDGILLDGKTLYVVQNRLNLIAVVQLNAELTAGEITARLTNPAFDVPTTIAEFGNSLYAVNARFGTPPEPETEYEIVQVTKEK
jgi:hypothetical protein